MNRGPLRTYGLPAGLDSVDGQQLIADVIDGVERLMAREPMRGQRLVVCVSSSVVLAPLSLRTPAGTATMQPVDWLTEREFTVGVVYERHRVWQEP